MNNIAIIGAGVSGLMMAKLLLEKGYKVVLFEASNTIGGRVKGSFFQNIPIDLGGQWLHQIEGEENTLTQILQEKGVHLVSDSKEEASIKQADGTFKKTIPNEVEAFFDYMLKQDFSVDQSVAKSIENYSRDNFLKEFLEAFVCDMATSTENMSSKVFCELLQSFLPEDFLLENESMYNFIQRYFEMIPKEAILLNTPITSINYTENGVILETSKGDQHTFSKCIISVPISQLQQNKITFSPALPSAKTKAFQQIGMGKGLKVMLFFKETLLPQTYFNMLHAPYYVPMEYSRGKAYAVITLLMGNYAAKYYQNPSQAKENILNELSQVSGKNSRELLLDCVFQDWTKEPYIEGTYSFAQVGEGNARKVASESVNEVLFFIGEAMNTKRANGFIHGAMDTAVQLAKQF